MGSSSKAEKEAVNDVEKDGREPVRKTLAGRIIGYTGMDPPSAFSSLIEGDRAENGIKMDGNEDNDKEGGGDDELNSLRQADLEMIEYEKIKSMKRKRGTLKKNHKPSGDAA